MSHPDLERRALQMVLTLGRRAMLLGMVLGFLLLLGSLLEILKAVRLVAGITAVSTLAAYVLAPAVNHLTNKRKINRILAITIVYAMVGLLILLGLTHGIPAVHEQFVMMAANFPKDVATLQSTLQGWYEGLLERTPGFLIPYVEQINPQTLNVKDYVDQLQNIVPGMVGSTFSGVFTGVKAAFGMLAAAVLVPLFTFYILMDAHRYREGFLRLFPRRWKGDVDQLMTEIDTVLGSYIRGQLLVCCTIGVSIAIVLNLLGLRYATLIGIFAGCVDIIPYVGVALGMVPAVIVALIYHGPMWAIVVVVAMEVVHWSEGHIVVPAVIGHSVGLPPLVVMLALGAGAELGGVMGMFLSIPLAAILRVLMNFYVRKLEDAESPKDFSSEIEGHSRKDMSLPSANGKDADVPSTVPGGSGQRVTLQEVAAPSHPEGTEEGKKTSHEGASASAADELGA